MLCNFFVFTSNARRLACCVQLALLLAACGSGGDGTIGTNSTAATSTTQSEGLFVIGVPQTSVQVGAMYTYVPAASAQDKRVLSYGVTNKPDWATFNERTGELSGVPDADDVGTTGEIQIDVSDGASHATVGPFRITVSVGPPKTGPSTAPTLTGIPAATVNAGQPYRFAPDFTDPANERLSFSVVNRPEWATFNTATGALSGTPSSADTGTFSNIVISVSGGDANISLPAFTVQVLPAEDNGPTIAGIPVATVAAGNPYSFTPTASDPNGNALTFSIVNAPPWARFSTTTGQLSGTPTVANVGVFQGIVISVTDHNETVALPAFSIQVRAFAAQTPGALLNYLNGLVGIGILSGQHADYSSTVPLDQVSLITKGTGQTPAILGTTLAFGSWTFNSDPIALSNSWLASGGIVLVSIWPGNPTYGDRQIGGITASVANGGPPVNFGNILTPGTTEYTRWQTFLATLATDFKSINGPIIVRPFVELNGGWFWWGQQPAQQFIAIWQQMVTYMRNQGVTNVLWCLNFSGITLPSEYATMADMVNAYYPGSDYVDILSVDGYPPSAADGPAITALSTFGKPLIFAESGGAHHPLPDTVDNSVVLSTIITQYPQIVADVVWSGSDALPVQQGMSAYMGNAKIIPLSQLPPPL